MAPAWGVQAGLKCSQMQILLLCSLIPQTAIATAGLQLPALRPRLFHFSPSAVPASQILPSPCAAVSAQHCSQLSCIPGFCQSHPSPRICSSLMDVSSSCSELPALFGACSHFLLCSSCCLLFPETSLSPPPFHTQILCAAASQHFYPFSLLEPWSCFGLEGV